MINEQDKTPWEIAKNKNIKIYYENFKKQPSFWNEIIAPYLNYILDQDFIKNKGPENIKKITYDRFNNIKFKSFICGATDNESRIDSTRKIEGMPDICVYIYHLVSVPENDSLDTLTGININQSLVVMISSRLGRPGRIGLGALRHAARLGRAEPTPTLAARGKGVT